MEHQKLINVKELAAYLQIHEMTAYRLAKEKKLPMFRVGSRWRARTSDVEKYILEMVKV